MYCGRSFEQWPVIELKERLGALGLSKAGRKAELFVRLCEADPSGLRANRVLPDIRMSSGEDNAEQQTNVEKDRQDNMAAGNDGVRTVNSAAELSIQERELDLLRRERDLVVRELEVLRIENASLREMGQRAASPGESPGSPIQRSITRSVTAPLPQATVRQKPNINAICELLSEFKGTSDVYWRWEKQFKLLCTTYELDDRAARILVGMKLRDQALKWFHSKPEHLEISVEELLEEMRKMFDHRPARIILKRNFEKRVWQVAEAFSEYFHDKVILANQVPIEEEEIVDYLIEGISDVHLRNQAKIQRFPTKEALLEAFERVRLEPEGKGRSQKGNDHARKEASDSAEKEKSQQARKVRCYNCNEFGHKGRDCQQPKRERGSCFNCGKADHRIKDCPQKIKKDAAKEKPWDATKGSTETETKQIGVVEEQIFRDLRYKFVNAELSVELTLRTLLDSGSPISFIKESFIPAKSVTRVNNENNKYSGLNKSPLEISGVVSATVEFEGEDLSGLLLRVVPDSSMQAPVVVGRDAWNILGLTVSREKNASEKREKENEHVDFPETDAYEILNISASVLAVDEVDALNINKEIAPEWHERLKELFRNEYLLAERPLTPKVRTVFKLKLKKHTPFHFAPRRLSYRERAQVEKIIEELKSKGIIRPSKSQYASRIVLVPKKSGEMRMCVDYRFLNALTERVNHPIPVTEEVVESINGNKYFSVVDLKNGFYHIEVAEESIPYTAFITPLGHYEFTKMPFGPMTAPMTFQEHVEKVMDELVRSGDMRVYLDDFFIATRTLERHLEVIKILFRTLVENRLELRLDKCKFLYTEIDFLGYIVTGDGIRPSESGIEAVKTYSVPTNVRGVQRFLGMCAYFRKFVKDFSIIAKPLYNLLRKDTVFKFGNEQLEAFETLKDKLIKSPVLALYSPVDETELHCDASSAGFGAALLQRKEDGKFHPVFYYSKRATEVESRYHSFELETLAIVYAFRKFRIYLHGIRFKVVTDCNSLIQTLKKKDINPRIARWALEMQDFDYCAEHRAGTKMPHVDALSRVYEVLVVEDNSFEANLQLCQTLDPKIREIREGLEKSEDRYYEMRDGLVYRKWGQRILFYVPRGMEYEVMHRYHNELGHFATGKTCEIIMQSYWFPKLREKVGQYIKNCFKCIAYSKPSGKLEGYVNSIPKESIPFSTIHVDHYGPIKGAIAKKHVFLVVDAFTKFVKLYAVKSTSSAETIKCLQEYFRAYSRPKLLISDRGTAFTSREFEDFLTEQNVKHVKVATGSPQANGQVERYNRVLASALGKLSDEESWPKALNEIEFALNNTFCKSTGAKPSVLLFGTGQRGKIIDYVKENVLEENNISERNLTEVRDKAAEQIAKGQSYNEQYRNQRRKPANEYEEGDLVVVRNFDSTVGVSNKLKPAYKGPYCVKKRLRNNRYILSDVEGHQLSQRPYQGVWESANIKPWRRDDSPVDEVEEDGRGGLVVRTAEAVRQEEIEQGDLKDAGLEPEL